MMKIRKTTVADVDIAASIYEEAKNFMRESGNFRQWADGYPNRESIIEDMNRGVSYVCEENEEILAIFMFAQENDSTYDKIYGGSWLDTEAYAVVHRIAVKAHGRGVASFIYNECFKLFPNLRMDTHRDNLPMQRSLTKNGFKYCGIIYLQNGEERLAYQKK